MLSKRTPGSLPSNMETNPEEHVKATTLRSGKELQVQETVHEKKKERESEVEEQSVRKEESQEKISPALPKEYQPHLLYPSRLRKDRDDEQYKKFLKLFKQLHINIPLVEALG